MPLNRFCVVTAWAIGGASRAWKIHVATSRESFTGLPLFGNRFKIISSKVSAGKISVNTVADSVPDASFTGVSPDLEDVYFYYINNQKN